MKTADFDYHLPREHIAQLPAEPRDAARLFILPRNGDQFQHQHFRDLGNYLRAGDVLVINQTRVIPARLFAHKPSGGKVELLLLRKENSLIWQALIGGKHVHPGMPLSLTDTLIAEVIEILPTGERRIQFNQPVESFLDVIGHVPLPPYIDTELQQPERYQTVYAHNEGSAAAPTAGLHFTPELMSSLEEKGVTFAHVTLHIGLDTFAPVTVESPQEHPIHSEWCLLSPETANTINLAKNEGRRIIAVGTTSVRTLETAARAAIQNDLDDISLKSETDKRWVIPYEGSTNLFITPGYQFRIIEGLITNFHLPKTTLLMLVSAFIGRERLLDAYQTAIEKNYRFFSFGDAMLII